MRAGATDFVVKPVGLERLQVAVTTAAESFVPPLMQAFAMLHPELFMAFPTIILAMAVFSSALLSATNRLPSMY